ncbi:DUF2155 domain-containing protein [Paracoccus jiaweipingae]|uniref:DUF2155 domain-containing protein n=1 Tax=unclassified Paracoccus (in: a-proteobacteria) TaxID=2688777 RepID=UPI0037B16ED9
MKTLFASCLTLTLLLVPALGQSGLTARGQGAILRGLDKVSGQTTDLALAVGDTVDYGRLRVHLAECRFPADDPSSDAFAELTIDDRAANKTVFSGWMIASSPALSALDDARYDIWVMSCSNDSASGTSAANPAGDSVSE